MIGAPLSLTFLGRLFHQLSDGLRKTNTVCATIEPSGSDPGIEFALARLYCWLADRPVSNGQYGMEF